MKVGCPIGSGWDRNETAPKVNVDVPMDLSETALTHAFSILRSHGFVPCRLEVHPYMEFSACRILENLKAISFLPIVTNEEMAKGGGWMVYGASIMGNEEQTDDR